MRKKYHKKGFIVVVVLITMILLIATGVALLNIGFRARLNSARVCSDICAKSAVDAAVAKALSHINQELADGILSDYALPEAENVPLLYCDATISYDIIKNDDGNYVIRATGYSGPVRKTAGAVLKSHSGSPFDKAIFVKGHIDIGNGMTVSAYNPDDPSAPMGTYPATIGTIRADNADIDVSGTVYGDAFCGVGGDPALCITGQQNITGSTYALTEEPEMLRPVMPDDIPNYGTIFEVDSTTITLTPEDSGIYSNIKLVAKGTPGIIYIDGGTVTLGSTDLMQMGRNCEIIVKEGSTLLLYLGEGLSSMSGASVSYNSATIDPTHIQIYGTGDAAAEGVDDFIWALKSKDVFQAIIYAPDAFVSINTGSSIYGAIVCSSFSGSSVDYFYDMSLASATNIALDTGGGTPKGFTISRWSE